MTNGAMTSLSTIRANTANPLEVDADGPQRRGPSGYLLLNVAGCWCSASRKMIGSLDVMPSLQRPARQLEQMLPRRSRDRRAWAGLAGLRRLAITRGPIASAA